MKTTVAVVSGVLLAAGGSASAQVLIENFEGGIPAAWHVEDYRPGGSGITWGVNTDTGRGNFTNGAGLAAMADSDAAGDGVEYDIGLITPVLHLPSASGLVLTYTSNYQNFRATDYADVDINDGNGWVTAMRWNEDHGNAFLSGPGDDVTIGLDAWAGRDVQVRFHYYDSGVNDWNWWWQMDNVTVTPAPGAAGLLGLGGLTAARRRRR